MSRHTNFIVLIGGPGTFEPCDHQHDQTWSNYIVPIQVATSHKQVNLSPGETLHWWVYAPAYRERWDADVADTNNPKLDRGSNLLDSRQKSLQKVKSSGAVNYLDRIKKFAGTVKAHYKEIETPDDFWKQLGAVASGSVSRLWYIGHASPGGLMLKLMHTDQNGVACEPVAAEADMIKLQDIGKHSNIISKALAKRGKPSKFYGCYTKTFAEQWNKLFSVGAEGAVSRIDFGLIDAPSTIKKVLPRLERGAGWQQYPAH
jgi:hypothetical protein